MKRIHTEYVHGPRGFSRWIQPVHRGYLYACCDCGLVHQMDFRVIEDKHVQFRTRRAARYTQRERRRQKYADPY